MRKKLVGIFIVMQLLVIIPSTSIAVKTSSDEVPLYTFLLGTFILKEWEENATYGFALRLRYLELREDGKTAGYITLRHVTIHSKWGFNMIKIVGQLFIIWGAEAGWMEIH